WPLCRSTRPIDQLAHCCRSAAPPAHATTRSAPPKRGRGQQELPLTAGTSFGELAGASFGELAGALFGGLAEGREGLTMRIVEHAMASAN
ncbi:unnamed protein product, partial [Closterium sp. NIES-54]